MSAGPEVRPFPIRVAAPELAASLVDLLQQVEVPHRTCPGGAEVPWGLRGVVLDVLASVFELDGDEDHVVIQGLAPRRKPPAADVLSWSAERLAEEPGEAVAALLELVEHGNRAQKSAAWSRVRGLADRDLVDLLEVLLLAVQQGRRGEVFALSRELREREHGGVAPAVAALLGRLEGPALELALHVLGQHPQLASAPLVLPLLDHAQEAVRSEADEVLCWISGEDMDFDADAPAEQRAAAVERWRQWVQARGAGGA